METGQGRPYRQGQYMPRSAPAIFNFQTSVNPGVTMLETRHVVSLMEIIAKALPRSLSFTPKLLAEKVALVPRGRLRCIRHALRYQKIKIGETRSFFPVERLRHVVLRRVIAVLEPVFVDRMAVDLGI